MIFAKFGFHIRASQISSPIFFATVIQEFVSQILVLLPRLCSRNFTRGLTGFVWERFGNLCRGLLALCSFFFAGCLVKSVGGALKLWETTCWQGSHNWLVWFVHGIWNSFWCTMCPKCWLLWRRCFGQFFCWYELFMNLRADMQTWSLPKILAQLLQHTIQEKNAVTINIPPKTTCALLSQMREGLKGHAFSVEFPKIITLKPTCKRIQNPCRMMTKLKASQCFYISSSFCLPIFSKFSKWQNLKRFHHLSTNVCKRALWRSRPLFARLAVQKCAKILAARLLRQLILHLLWLCPWNILYRISCVRITFSALSIALSLEYAPKKSATETMRMIENHPSRVYKMVR